MDNISFGYLAGSITSLEDISLAGRSFARHLHHAFGVDKLLTEDFSHGQEYHGIVAINPLADHGV